MKNVGRALLVPLRGAWRAWLAVSRALGVAHMVLTLTIVYWVVMPLAYPVFGWRADPLRLRRRAGSGWRRREPQDDAMAHLSRQW